MNPAIQVIVFWVAISSLLMGTPLQAAPPPVPPGGAPPLVEATRGDAPLIRMIEPGLFEVESCHISKKEGQAEFPATVNMREGLLEYLIVGEGGKLHESLLRTAVRPYALQIALLLLGLEGSEKTLAAQGDTRMPEGDPVEIWVRWQAGGTETTGRLENWVRRGQEKVERLPWVFTGSFVADGVFQAGVDQSIAAVFHDPVAMLDHQLPEGANDEIWFVDSEKTPPVGTKVMVIIRQVKGEE